MQDIQIEVTILDQAHPTPGKIRVGNNELPKYLDWRGLGMRGQTFRIVGHNLVCTDIPANHANIIGKVLRAR